jgi:hypothetical protein
MTERDWLGTLFAEIHKIERDLCPKVMAMPEGSRVEGEDGITMSRLWAMRSEAKQLADRIGVRYNWFANIAAQGLAG